MDDNILHVDKDLQTSVLAGYLSRKDWVENGLRVQLVFDISLVQISLSSNV